MIKILAMCQSPDNMDLLLFLISFALILVGCEFFTNGVEFLGKRLKLDEGAIGSVLAAVGTAMPETLVPLIAIVLVGGSAGEDIGAGAILGSPFMLATVALFVMGLAIILFRKRRKRNTLAIEGMFVRRDLKFFLLAYGMAATVAFLPKELVLVKWAVGLCLFPIYVYYLSITLRASDGGGEEEEEDLLVLKLFKRGSKEEDRKEDGCHDYGCDCHDAPGIPLIAIQAALGLLGIIVGAYLFVDQIEALAGTIGLNPLILALLVAPIATELPEMYNSIIWTRSGKDKFALGNITGSMVFQSCIPVTFGVLLTGWTLDLSQSTDQLQAVSIIFALASATVLVLRSRGTEIKPGGLLLGGIFYATFIALVLLIG